MPGEVVLPENSTLNENQEKDMIFQQVKESVQWIFALQNLHTDQSALT
jgi:hypothetical protein